MKDWLEVWPDQFWHVGEEAGKVGAEEEGPESVLLVEGRPQKTLHCQQLQIRNLHKIPTPKNFA